MKRRILSLFFPESHSLSVWICVPPCEALRFGPGRQQEKAESRDNDPPKLRDLSWWRHFFSEGRVCSFRTGCVRESHNAPVCLMPGIEAVWTGARTSFFTRTL
jgi:hypothetical protein